MVSPGAYSDTKSLSRPLEARSGSLEFFSLGVDAPYSTTTEITTSRAGGVSRGEAVESTQEGW